MQPVQWEAGFATRKEWRTGMMKLIAIFRNFVKITTNNLRLYFTSERNFNIF